MQKTFNLFVLIGLLTTGHLKQCCSTSSSESHSSSSSHSSGSGKRQNELLLTESRHNHDFDVLLFTQRWPVSGCLSWLESNKKHRCSLPSPKEIWIIHGIWPTKYGTIGPQFCNASATFDVHQLAPFETQLIQFWMNIQDGKGVSSLWKHEWLKHGTCAAQLPSLDSENKYFGQGLSWMQQYTMSSILQKGGILPDVNHTLLEIHGAIVSVLKKNPSIHCFFDPIQNKIYLDEIRICFNKSLELVDCDGVTDDTDGTIAIDYPGGKIITNCDLASIIEYPSIVPEARLRELRGKMSGGWKFPFVNVYKLIQLVQWFTL